MNELWRTNRHLLITGSVLTLVSICFLLLHDHRSNIPLFLGLFFLYFGVYVAVLLVKKRPGRGEWSTGLIVGFAILFRVIFLITPPSLSDDVNRYVWDGRVQAAGINPYIFAPADEQLTDLRDETVFPKINHKEIPTIYPPLTQLFFRVVVSISPSVFAMNLAFGLAELLIVFVLIRILAVLELDPQNVLVYAWNPLVLVEYAGNGHVDALGVLLLFLAIYGCLRSKHLRASFFLAASFVSKFFSALILPFMLKRPLFVHKKLNVSVVALFLTAVCLSYVPFLDAGNRLISGLTSYAVSWHFNDASYSVLYWFFGLFFSDNVPFVLMDYEIDNLPRLLSRMTLALAFGGVLFSCWRWHFRLDDPKAAPLEWVRICFIVSGAFLLLNPTFHPWYMLWVIPYLAIFENRAWILFSGLIALSYLVLIGYDQTGVWQESLLVRSLEYLPFLILLGGDAVIRRLKRQTEDKHAI